jgi:hypothetical protein
LARDGTRDLRETIARRRRALNAFLSIETRIMTIKTAFATLSFALSVLCLTGCTERPAASPQPASSEAESPQPAAPAVDVLRPSPVAEIAPLLALPTSGTCSLENMLDLRDNAPRPGAEPNTYAADAGGAYTFVGFATDSDEGTVPAAIRVLLHGPAGAFAIDAGTGESREDVAKFFGKPGLAKSGYRFVADLSALSAGAYEVHIVKGESADAELCPTHQTIVIP